MPAGAAGVRARVRRGVPVVRAGVVLVGSARQRARDPRAAAARDALYDQHADDSDRVDEPAGDERVPALLDPLEPAVLRVGPRVRRRAPLLSAHPPAALGPPGRHLAHRSRGRL